MCVCVCVFVYFSNLKPQTPKQATPVASPSGEAVAPDTATKDSVLFTASTPIATRSFNLVDEVDQVNPAPFLNRFVQHYSQGSEFD